MPPLYEHLTTFLRTHKHENKDEDKLSTEKYFDQDGRWHTYILL